MMHDDDDATSIFFYFFMPIWSFKIMQNEIYFGR